MCDHAEKIMILRLASAGAKVAVGSVSVWVVRIHDHLDYGVVCPSGVLHIRDSLAHQGTRVAGCSSARLRYQNVPP